MNARTHDAFAFASLITAAAFFPPEKLNLLTAFSAIIACDIGASIPDLDDAGNRLWGFLPSGDSLGKVLRKVFYKHRTLTHSLLGCFFIYKFLEWGLPKVLNPAFIDPHIILGSIMVGYISHLIGDFITKDGLPLLFPFKYYFGFPPFKSLRLRTGSWVENFVVLPAIGIYLFFFIRMFQENLLKLVDLVKS